MLIPEVIFMITALLIRRFFHDIKVAFVVCTGMYNMAVIYKNQYLI
jgi:hypothetical protein